ncbi:MAG: hypothetical protein NZ739_07710 [Verrucomicrobiae bacterium]|nr:hypothetical protein [Verrucomicrobiae bacterium]MDW7979207.1 hypothetical protein [Verrucomicrobiales bacterium]
MTRHPAANSPSYSNLRLHACTPQPTNGLAARRARVEKAHSRVHLDPIPMPD